VKIMEREEEEEEVENEAASDVRFINLSFADPRQSLPLPSQNHNSNPCGVSLSLFLSFALYIIWPEKHFIIVEC
jgi:hypothetical protein